MRQGALPLRASSRSLCLFCKCSLRTPSPWNLSFCSAFSTTQPRQFLLAGKQDKKKHQQFVRRWQKRLLGDSEPIGAHVDPYDSTSPVRISPDEQGDYEEVLDADGTERKSSDLLPDIVPEVRNGRLHVGGEQWRKERMQRDLAREFEKLTLRTYTPLSLEMANVIEKWTGTWYTLRDENLLMAQTVHDRTGRPYTRYNFGLQKKTTDSRELRRRFAQAVAEVYTLKQAGVNMDLSKFANRGIYDQPSWIRHIKLVESKKREPLLAFPKGKNADLLLQVMKAVPVLEPSQATEDAEPGGEEAPESPKQLQNQEPFVADSKTPNLQKVALVKMDPNQKSFDFMSNRPISRSTLADKANTTEAVQPTGSRSPSGMPKKDSSFLTEMDSAVASSAAVISQLRHDFSEHRAQHLVGNMRMLGQNIKAEKQDTVVEEAKWRQVPITSTSVKFALFKRLLQLTGIRISDLQLTNANTLGDLYGFLCAAAKPKPTSLFSTIHIEGQKARARARDLPPLDEFINRKADLGDLIKLGNVEIHKVKPSKQESREKTGIGKVIDYALMERGLAGSSRRRPKTNRRLGLLQEV